MNKHTGHIESTGEAHWYLLYSIYAQEILLDKINIKVSRRGLIFIVSEHRTSILLLNMPFISHVVLYLGHLTCARVKIIFF